MGAERSFARADLDAERQRLARHLDGFFGLAEIPAYAPEGRERVGLLFPRADRPRCGQRLLRHRGDLDKSARDDVHPGQALQHDGAGQRGRHPAPVADPD